MCKKTCALKESFYLLGLLGLLFMSCSNQNSTASHLPEKKQEGKVTSASDNDDVKLLTLNEQLVGLWLRGHYDEILDKFASISVEFHQTRTPDERRISIQLQQRYRQNSPLVQHLNPSMRVEQAKIKQLKKGFARSVLTLSLAPAYLDKWSQELKQHNNKLSEWERKLLERISFVEFRLGGLRFMQGYYREDDNQWKPLHWPLALNEDMIQSIEQNSNYLEPPTE